MHRSPTLYDNICEMKRLFVRDDFRGKRIGVELIEKIIADAREIGYSQLHLDTYPPKMGKAVKLYESHGFGQIAPFLPKSRPRCSLYRTRPAITFRCQNYYRMHLAAAA